MTNNPSLEKTDIQELLEQDRDLLQQLKKTKMARSISSIRPLILAALIGGAPLLNSCSKDDFVEQTQNQIEKVLQAKGSYYDQKTKATYVFGDIDTHEKSGTMTRSLAPKQESDLVFQANPKVLQVQITDQQAVDQLQEMGYLLEELVPNVYQVDVQKDVLLEKEQLEKLPGVNYVGFEYYIPVGEGMEVGGDGTTGGSPAMRSAMETRATSIQWNDPNIRHGPGEYLWQQWHSDRPWIENGRQVDITQATDSLRLLKEFHNSDNINLCLIDDGIDINNSEFNVKYALNLETGQEGVNVQSKHGNAVGADAVGALNNANAGGGILQGRDGKGGNLYTFDAGMTAYPGSLSSNHITKSLQKILDFAKANPTQYYIINMSFAMGDDPTIYALVIQLDACKTSSGAKQVYMVGGTGNTGNQNPAVWPAAWKEVFPVGATYASNPKKTLWDKTQLDLTRPMFVIDGAANPTLYSLDGTVQMVSGTSNATPKVSGLIGVVLAQQEGLKLPPITSYDQMRDLLIAGSVPVENTNGADLHYPSAWRVTSNRAVEHLPKTFDAQNNATATLNFAPKGYNLSDVSKMTGRRLIYPNGQECTTYTDASGVRTYQLKITGENGFKNNEPVTLYYQFQTPVSATDFVKIPMQITAKNVVGAVLPSTPTTQYDLYQTEGTSVIVSGTADAGNIITITIQGQTPVTTTVGIDGKYTATLPVPATAGVYPTTLVAKNTTTGKESAVKTISIEKLAVPTIPTSTQTKYTTTGTSVVVSGTADPGNTITITVAGQSYTTTVGTDGKYAATIPVPAAIGIYPTTIVAKNAKGTESPTLNISIEKVDVPPAPATPTTTIPNGYKTRESSLTFTGSALAGSTVKITIGGNMFSGAADATGKYSINTTIPSTAGSYEVSITATDKNGTSEPLKLNVIREVIQLGVKMNSFGVLNIAIPENSPITSFSVTSSTGREVYKGSVGKPNAEYTFNTNIIQDGTYTVALKNASGATVNTINVVKTSTGTYATINRNGELTVTLPQALAPASVEVYNIAGAKVYTGNVQATNGTFKIATNIAAMGPYKVKIKNANGIVVAELTANVI